MADFLDERAISLLKWRARRGLLECDLLIQRFFERHGQHLTARHADGFIALMNLDDPALLDLLLARAQPQDEWDQPDVHEVLALMRTPGVPTGRVATHPVNTLQRP
jgi:antitoxin CptB